MRFFRHNVPGENCPISLAPAGTKNSKTGIDANVVSHHCAYSGLYMTDD